jgi:glycosyltransferase involved in cell wall biosynthesis
VRTETDYRVFVSSARSAPELSVVIPTFNRAKRCAGLLRALAEQSLESDRFEVLAVDNYSEDETSEVLRSLAGTLPYDLRPLRTSSNHGPAAARNLGWRSASAPVVAFIDDDCVPTDGWLAAGLEAVMVRDNVGVVQGCTTQPPDLDETKLKRWNHRQNIVGPTPHFEACNIFYRRAALDSTGGFYEDIGWWGEDAAAGWKVMEAGWDRSFARDAIVFHEVSNRSVGWYIRNGFREFNMVRLAAEHPGFRREAFWRPWAYRREDASFVAAVLGGLLACRWRPAALAAIPYLWWQRPSVRERDFIVQGLERVAVDASRSAGQIAGAVRYRLLVV